MALTYLGDLEAFDPFAELRRLQDDIARAFRSAGLTSGADFPPVNVWAGTDGVVLRAELPGVRSQDIDVSILGHTVTIKGKREPEPLGEGAAYQRRERGHGSFVRSLTLPFEIDPDGVEASYADGILELRLRPPEAAKPRKISVKAG